MDAPFARRAHVGNRGPQPPSGDGPYLPRLSAAEPWPVRRLDPGALGCVSERRCAWDGAPQVAILRVPRRALLRLRMLPRAPHGPRFPSCARGDWGTCVVLSRAHTTEIAGSIR